MSYLVQVELTKTDLIMIQRALEEFMKFPPEPALTNPKKFFQWQEERQGTEEDRVRAEHKIIKALNDSI